MFWTTVTSQTSSEKRRTNRHTVKPTVMFGSRLKSGIRKRVAHASVFSQVTPKLAHSKADRTLRSRNSTMKELVQFLHDVGVNRPYCSCKVDH